MSTTKVITGKVRLSYAYVWEPKEQPSGDEKYSTCILIPKNDVETLEMIDAAIDDAEKSGSEKYWGKKNKGLKYPLRDGDDEDDRGDRGDEFIGHYFVNANSNRAPGIVDRYNVRIEDESEVYSGCYARASVNFYPFQAEGSKGIACGLNNIQKIADGEPLFEMSLAPEDDFDVYTEDEKSTTSVSSGKRSRTRQSAQYTEEEIIAGKGDLPFGEDDDIGEKVNRRRAA